jgi:hypothetical protein
VSWFTLRNKNVSLPQSWRFEPYFAAAQGVALLLGLPVQFDIAVGEVEEFVDVVGRQAVDPEQMPVRERGLGGASLHEPGTIGGTPPSGNNAELTGPEADQDRKAIRAPGQIAVWLYGSTYQANDSNTFTASSRVLGKRIFTRSLLG